MILKDGGEKDMNCNLEKEPTYPFKMWVYNNQDLLMMIHRFKDFGHEAEVISDCVCIAFDDEDYTWLNGCGLRMRLYNMTLAKQNERL